MKYLGKVLNGLHPDQSKVAALRERPLPKSQVEERSDYVLSIAQILRPREERAVVLDTARRKEAIHAIETQILVPYSLTRPLRFTAESSPIGAGTILSQVLPTASKTFLPAEKNLVTDIKPMTAIFGDSSHIPALSATRL